jgi:hypothetical protein
MDEEEKMEEIRKILKKDLDISDEDIDEVMQNVERKNKIKKILISMVSIEISIAIIAIALFIAITENNVIYWFFAFIVTGLVTMEIVTFRKKMKQEEMKKNQANYCAQITDGSSNYPNVKKQEVFSNIEEAKNWISHIKKEEDSARIINLFDGNIISNYKNRIKEVEIWKREQNQ